MLNLELPGVSLLLAVSLLELFFFASPVATRYVSPFLRCIKRCCKGQEQVFLKTVSLEYYPTGGDFFGNVSLNLSQ